MCSSIQAARKGDKAAHAAPARPRQGCTHTLSGPPAHQHDQQSWQARCSQAYNALCQSLQLVHGPPENIQWHSSSTRCGTIVSRMYACTSRGSHIACASLQRLACMQSNKKSPPLVQNQQPAHIRRTQPQPQPSAVFSSSPSQSPSEHPTPAATCSSARPVGATPVGRQAGSEARNDTPQSVLESWPSCCTPATISKDAAASCTVTPLGTPRAAVRMRLAAPGTSAPAGNSAPVVTVPTIGAATAAVGLQSGSYAGHLDAGLPHSEEVKAALAGNALGHDAGLPTPRPSNQKPGNAGRAEPFVAAGKPGSWQPDLPESLPAELVQLAQHISSGRPGGTSGMLMGIDSWQCFSALKLA